MSKDDNAGKQAPPRRVGREGMDRAVELARRVLKEEGLSDFQIDALLKRQRAPVRQK